MLAQTRLEVVATDSGETVLMAPGARGQPEVVARVAGQGPDASREQVRAAAERLAACWNLCCGVPDDLLDTVSAKASLPDRLQTLLTHMRRHSSGLIPAAQGPSHWHG